MSSERLHNLQPKRHILCMHTETNPIVFISHHIAPRRTVDSEITSNPCNHIWLCNRSIDGDTVQLKNGGRPSDVAHYTLALSKGKRALPVTNSHTQRLTRLDHRAHHRHPTQATAP